MKTGFASLTCLLTTICLFAVKGFAQPVAPTPAQVAEMQLIEATARAFGPQVAADTEAMVVDPSTRAESRAFYQAVYFAGVDEPITWTGSLSGTPASSATGTPGTTSAAFKDAVRTRINWYRAMAGLPAQVTFNDTYSAKSQQAALMMSANNTLSHTPSSSWLLYTAEGAEAAGSSDLALGSYGVAAINGYMIDPYSNNTAVGHRRWIIYPQTQIMGTGDVPSTGSFNSANSTWVFDSNYGGTRPSVRDGFVAWPTKGYVPYTVVPARWSFAYPGANFANASVTVTKNGTAVTAVKETLANGYGENSLVWVVDGLDTDSLQPHAQPSSDVTYVVTITGITNAPQSSYAYTVVVYDPAMAGAEEILPTVSGSTQPAQGAAATYAVSIPAFASSYLWRTVAFAAAPSGWGAESGTTSDLVADTTGSYSTNDTGVKASGQASYHLCQPTAENQTLTVPGAYYVSPSATNPALSLASRLSWATSTQTARVQISLNDGVAWADLYAQSGSNGSGESSFTTKSLSLSAYAGRVVRFRFQYSYDGGSYYYDTSSSVGWHIDNVSLSGVNAVTTSDSQAALSGDAFNFTPTSTASIGLQACPQLFLQYPMEWGPVLVVTPTVISRTTPTLTWSTPAAITYGAALSSSQLNATADVAGTFVYSPVLGTVLDAGSQTLSVTFTPTDSANYTTASATTTLTVAPASLVAKADDQTKVAGSANPNLTITYTGLVNGDTADVLDQLPVATTTATTASGEGTYPITLSGGSDANYTFTLQSGTLTVTANVSGVAITTSPVAQTVVAGATATFTVVATGSTVQYQWQSSADGVSWTNISNGTTYGGATSASLSVLQATATLNGTRYRCLVSNGVDAAIASESATLTVRWSQFAALSTRAPVASGDQTLILGFVFAGGGKPTLVRGIGPGLSSYVTGYLTDPELSLYGLSGGAWTLAGSNDDWDGSASLVSTMSSLGAGALESGSKDAAMLQTLTGTVYTAQITGVGGTSGVALAEAYDASFADKSKRLTALSVRNQVGVDDAILIAGFVISGDANKRVIVRGVGPGIASSVASYLADPQLELWRYANGAWSLVASNDNWDSTAETAAVFAAAGMGALATGSADAAFITELAPGVYTAQLSGVGRTTGVGMVEIYEAP